MIPVEQPPESEGAEPCAVTTHALAHLLVLLLAVVSALALVTGHERDVAGQGLAPELAHHA